MQDEASGDLGLVLDPIAIRQALPGAGFRTFSALARKIGISPGYMGMVSRGLIPPEKIREAVAEALKVPQGSLWKVGAPGDLEIRGIDGRAVDSTGKQVIGPDRK